MPDTLNPPKTASNHGYVTDRDEIHFSMDGQFMTGVDMWIHATAETTDGKLILIETNWVRGTEPPWHIHHHEEEGFFVLDGEIVIHTEQGHRRAAKGEFVWGPKDEKHTYQVVGEEARVLVIFVPGNRDKFQVGGGIDKFFYEARTVELDTPEKVSAAAERLVTVYGVEMFPDQAPPPRPA